MYEPYGNIVLQQETYIDTININMLLYHPDWSMLSFYLAENVPTIGKIDSVLSGLGWYQNVGKPFEMLQHHQI